MLTDCQLVVKPETSKYRGLTTKETKCGAARAKTPATRQAWERVAARMASYSITICAFIIPLGQSEKASACQDGQECQMLLFSELLKRILIKNLVRHLRVMTECINVITHEVCS